MGKKSENGKKRPHPQTPLPRLRYQLLIDVNEMRVKNITVTVSVRVSVTVRVSLVFSGRELTFTFAMLSAVRLSVVCLSVTLVHPTQPDEVFGNIFSPYDSSGTLVF